MRNSLYTAIVTNAGISSIPQQDPIYPSFGGRPKEGGVMSPVGVTGSATLAFIFDAIAKQTKRAHRGTPNKPKGGQSEIRTRGRLPFNGFQDRLFRPLRHLSNVQCTKRQYSTAFGNLQHRTHINSVVRRQSRFVHPKNDEKEDSQPRSVAKHRIVNQKTTPAPR